MMPCQMCICTVESCWCNGRRTPQNDMYVWNNILSSRKENAWTSRVWSRFLENRICEYYHHISLVIWWFAWGAEAILLVHFLEFGEVWHLLLLFVLYDEWLLLLLSPLTLLQIDIGRDLDCPITQFLLELRVVMPAWTHCLIFCSLIMRGRSVDYRELLISFNVFIHGQSVGSYLERDGLRRSNS